MSDELVTIIQQSVGMRKTYTFGQVYFMLSALVDLMSDNITTENDADK